MTKDEKQVILALCRLVSFMVRNREMNDKIMELPLPQRDELYEDTATIDTFVDDEKE